MLNNQSFKNSGKDSSLPQLSEKEVLDYLDRIEVRLQLPSLSLLQDIVVGTLAHLPFQNLSMLSNERIRPSPENICSDMISGLGGLCTVRNPFLYRLLTSLGFKVRFVSATIQKPDCHIVLIVKIDEDDWWVDVGNGYPYQFPIRLGDQEPKSHPFLQYRLISKDDGWSLEHFRNDEWNINYHFSAKGVDYTLFDEMHRLHYSEPGWGPFLTGLRVNRWWDDKFAILRDNLGTSPDGEEILDSPTKISDWIAKWFPKNGFLENVNVTESFYIWKFEVGMIRKSEELINQVHEMIGGDAEKQGTWQLELMKSFGLKPEHKFLDYGCGTLRGGLFVIPYLRETNYTGIEINPLFVRVAKRLIENNKLEYLQPRIITTNEITSLDEQFDYILTQSVLNHLEEKELTVLIENISDMLGKNGSWVSTVCYDSNIETINYKTPHPFRDNETLNSRFNPGWFESLLNFNGLKIEHLSDLIHSNRTLSIVLIKKMEES